MEFLNKKISRRGAPMGDMARHLAKVNVRRNEEAERAAQEWIEQVAGESFPSNRDYVDSLRDGILLCKVMNTILPGSIRKVHDEDAGDFRQMENLARFTEIANKKLGVHEMDTFQTVDLFESRNIPQVTRCIYAVASKAKELPEWKGPLLVERKRKVQEEDDDSSPYACIS